MLDQDHNLISLIILSTCFLDNVWILKGEVSLNHFEKLVKGFKC